MRVCVRRSALVAGVLAGLLLVGAGPAAAAVTGAHPAASLVVVDGSIFGKIAGAVLGAFSWTTGVAAKFILVTLAAFIRMLIPASWAHVPVAVFDWIVAVPNYAGSITSPSGQTGYGFAGVNAIREVFQWIGIALVPVTLTWSTSRAMLGVGEPPAAPLVRLLGMAVVLVFYPWLWAQAAAVVDQITHLILATDQVTQGIRQLMAYATEGVALGGWQLIDLGLIGAVASELLALVFVKVIVVLVGAILYAVGPLMIGVVATEGGATVTRAWAAAAITWLAVPVAWAVIFAVGAVLITDASTAGVLVGGSSTIEQILGGVIVAIAGVATLWLCLRASREAHTVARGQLATITPALGHLRATSNSGSGAGARAATSASSRGASPRAAQSLRSFQTRVAGSAGAAMTAAGPRGARAATVGSHAVQLGRQGVIRSGANLAGSTVRGGARSVQALRTPTSPGAGSGMASAHNSQTGPMPGALTPATRVSRARATASRMIAGGRAGWRNPTATARGHSADASPTRRAPQSRHARPAGRSRRPTQAPRPNPQSRSPSSHAAATRSPATRSPVARPSQTPGRPGGDKASSRPGVTTRPQPIAPSSTPAADRSPRPPRARPSGPASQPAPRTRPRRTQTTTSTTRPAAPRRADRAPRPGPASDTPPTFRRPDRSEGER
jgi:hypothetical protein